VYTKAPIIPGWSWSGFYVGANGGWGWDAKTQDILVTSTPAFGGYPATTAGTSAKGGFGGVTAGYNWQLNAFVVGVEGDFDVAGIQDKFNGRVINVFGDQLTAEKSLKDVSTIRGRLGYAFDKALVYGTGGVAFGQVHDRLSLAIAPTFPVADVNKDGWQTGYTVGGGVEYMILPHVSVKAEYQYVNLGSTTTLSGTPTVPPIGIAFTGNSTDNAFHTVRGGVNWHF
jgi:outer membrane immunogenic protein